MKLRILLIVLLPIILFSCAPDISKNKPLLVGWNEDEFTFFAMVGKDTAFTKFDFCWPQHQKQIIVFNQI